MLLHQINTATIRQILHSRDTSTDRKETFRFLWTARRWKSWWYLAWRPVRTWTSLLDTASSNLQWSTHGYRCPCCWWWVPVPITVISSFSHQSVVIIIITTTFTMHLPSSTPDSKLAFSTNSSYHSLPHLFGRISRIFMTISGLNRLSVFVLFFFFHLFCLTRVINPLNCSN